MPEQSSVLVGDGSLQLAPLQRHLVITALVHPTITKCKDGMGMKLRMPQSR